jgi:hypothetical protein
MSGIEDNGLINKFLEKELSGEEKILFKQKFEQEELFRNEVRQYAQMIITLKASDKIIDAVETIPLVNTVNFRRYLIAASITLLAGIGFYLMQPYFKGRKSIEFQQPYDLMAKNYQPNPTIENALKQSFRSVTARIEFDSPSDSIEVKERSEVRFSISSQKMVEYHIVLFDNQLKTMLTSCESKNNTLSLAINLSPGLYYWKYEFNEQSGWGGKIIVIQ